MLEPSRGAALDEIDIAILTLLREDARRTLTDIATHVSLSLAPVKRRLHRLERSGVIRGYTVLIDPGVLRAQIGVYCSIRLAAESSEEVVSWLLDTFVEVDEVSAMTGDDEFMVKLHVENVARLHEILDDFRRHSRITSTRTGVVLRTWTRKHPNEADTDPD